MDFLVTRAHWRNWDTSRLRREQDGWDDHAAFMNQLVADGHSALLVVEAASEADVRARLADDPWSEHVLATDRIEPWAIFLRRSPG